MNYKSELMQAAEWHIPDHTWGVDVNDDLTKLLKP